MTKENQSASVDDALDVFDALDIDGDLAANDKPADENPRDEETSNENIEDEQGKDEQTDDNDDDTDSNEDELEAGETEGETEPETDASEKAKKPNRTQARIDKLTREKNDERREKEYWKRLAEQNAATPQAPQVQATQEQINEGAQQGLTPDQVQGMIQQEAQKQVDAERFQSKVDTLRKTLVDSGAGDALDRLSNQALTPFEKEAVQALSEAKYGAEVAKAIAGNEDLFSKFSALKSGVERARLIDRLDGRLEARAKPTSKKVKATPKVRGAARKPNNDPDDMSQAEYEAYRVKMGWA